MQRICAIYSGEIDSALDDDSSLALSQSSSSLKKASDKCSQQKIQIDTNIDSGCIVDSAQMISTGGVGEGGLPDWFNNLSIKDSPSINNLDGTKDKSNQQLSQQQQQQQQQQKSSIEANLWKLCYRQDSDGDTQLHLAIINEIPHIIWAIIRLAPAAWLLDQKNDDAQAPIHLAVLTRQPNVVRRLLVAGANASIRDGDGNTALHLACINGDMTTVEALLKPITAAELKEYNQSAHQLPQSNASRRQFSIDLEQRNFYGENCVHIAAQQNHVEILKLLIREGADINAREGRAGYTSLHIAVENNNMELAKFLLESSKQLNTETFNYRQVTAYQLAAELEHSDMLQILERYGCEMIPPPESDMDESDESFDADPDNN
ncbi:NF-kappa-B inhibitor cactus isoform X2 [Sitodiplosis mosellana]|uniref:NF-kappa-B inhibitor cactus isoform X2 n=1 Tax=Sitodiplosis mosellana TaxID=263140 RepID=UPI0024447BA5|nr:NF-kappa-B inhibitor cactus isoform X2 [Sitodiplosis mosellana]